MQEPDGPTLILRNAFNGETFIFPKIRRDSTVAKFGCILEKGGSGGGNALVHIHPGADEIFEVKSGRILVVADGKEQLAEVGKPVAIPRGAAHYFKNAGSEQAEFTVTFAPAQRHFEFFLNFALLAEKQPQWFSAKGDPDFLLIALTLHTYRDHLYLSRIPVMLQKILFALLAPLASARGYRLEILPDGSVGA